MEVRGQSYTIFVVSKRYMLFEGRLDSPALFPPITIQEKLSHPLCLNHIAQECSNEQLELAA